MTITIALVQLAVQEGDPEANVCRVERLIQKSPGADVYLLPELWTTGYCQSKWAEAADATPKVLHCVAGWTRARSTWIGGSLISRRTESDGRLVNRFWLVGPKGESAWYDKAHLFPPMGEDRRLAGGIHLVRRPLAGFDVLLSICFDLRFPEMYRQAAALGSDLFLVPAEWPHPRCQILRTLAAARAIENQAFLALCNRVGTAPDGTEFCGNSTLWGPDGAVLAEAGDSEEIAIGEASPEAAAAVRHALPVLDLRVRGLDY